MKWLKTFIKRKGVTMTVKGYKCFDKNLQCRGYQFEVGKTFKAKGELRVCVNGFHFCEKPAAVFNYYSFDPTNRVCEIEALGDVIQDGDKSCTDSIRIVRELSWNEVLEICNTGLGNTGLSNSGSYNSGNYNSGYCNSGDYNSGSYNTGLSNSGDYNSGHRNNGHCNSGSYNSGDYNRGYRNSGDYNSGSYNSGSYNSGHRNSGLFNTNEPNVRLFNRQTKIRLDDPRIQRVLCGPGPVLSEWIPFENMSAAEKKLNPKAETTGGILKTLSYKEAWLKFWDNATQDVRNAYLNLPFFDAKIFEEITGLKVEQPKRKKHS